jgi:hypothetical protein
MPLGYAQSGGCSERKKDPSHNKVIGNQGDTTAEERQTAEQSKVARFIVHSRFPIRRGSDQAAPPCARVDGLEPFTAWSPAAGRQAIFLGATGPRAARPEKARRGATPSRPRPVGGVNELVKCADIDALTPRKESEHDDCRDYRRNKGSNPPTNVASTLDSIEQALNRHGVIPFSTPTPGVRLL